MTLLLTIAVTVLILAVAAGVTARTRRARPAVTGVGLAMLPVGLYLTGLTQLTANGIRSLIDWFQRTPWTTVTSWGVGLLVAGAVLLVVAGFLKGSRAKTPSEPQAKQTSAPARPQVAAPSNQPTAKPAAATKQKGLDAEDAEIEALLRKRGIM